LKRFEFYLSGRSQWVCGPTSSSAWALISADVPQSSVFGPLLFATFIDLRFFLKHSHHISYADDLQIYFHFPPREVEVAMEKIMKDCRHWVLVLL